jgi:large subunit ribosomal protein L31e
MTAKEKKTPKEKKTEAPKEEKAVKHEAHEKAEKTEAKAKKPKESVEPSKTYVISLRDAFVGFRSRRAKRASKVVKEFLAKHVKTEVKIAPDVNEFILAGGRRSIPRKIKVIVSKEGDRTTAKLAE